MNRARNRIAIVALVAVAALLAGVTGAGASSGGTSPTGSGGTGAGGAATTPLPPAARIPSSGGGPCASATAAATSRP